LRIYDKNVNIASLVGANRDFILNRIPHISKLMVHEIDAVLNHAQTVVIGTNDPKFNKVAERLQEGQFLIDFCANYRKGEQEWQLRRHLLVSGVWAKARPWLPRH
jgi:GDP-mannose 6-dehydrogenase